MEEPTPKGRGRQFSDQELRDAIGRGMKPAEIAQAWGVSRQAVYKRVNQLKLTTTAALVAPEESRRFVRSQVDVMQQLTLNVGRANLLMDACDEWLRDADHPEKYDVGARAEEVDVTYEVEIETPGPNGEVRYRQEKRKKKLTEIMAQFEGYDDDGARFVGWKHGETKRADPRELILKTQAETRHTVGVVADLIQKLTDAEVMAEWRAAVIEEIAKESPDCARRIAERVQRSIVLHAAFCGPGAVQPN